LIAAKAFIIRRRRTILKSRSVLIVFFIPPKCQVLVSTLTVLDDVVYFLAEATSWFVEQDRSEFHKHTVANGEPIPSATEEAEGDWFNCLLIVIVIVTTSSWSVVGRMFQRTDASRLYRQRVCPTSTSSLD